MTARRVAAGAALVLAPVSLLLAAAVAIVSFPGGLLALGLLALALLAGWHGLVHRGPARVLGLGAAIVLAAAVVVLLVGPQPLLVAAAVAAVWLALGAARTAFRMHVTLPPAPRPRRPVLFYNPRSGGGKAERLQLAAHARSRGIEPVELTAGTDLETLVRDAVAGGADALAMAGGDGSQAVVATAAAELGLPYACIPAGTRNHFALDLGVDRDDVVGALDAFVAGGERVVDLADVNGRVFVNNVSLGFYADAVQRAGYREAKARTLLDTLPDAITQEHDDLGLRWLGPDGPAQGGVAILVSNNRYRLRRGVGTGTRPRIDGGLLGITVVGVRAEQDGRRGSARLSMREWTAPAFDIEATHPVAAGIDGEAAMLEPPLRFRIHPAALRVRIAPHHPGASPSASEPEGAWESVRALATIAAGRDASAGSRERV